MRLLLFGGTTEGRVLAQALSGLGHRVTVSVATELGAEELRDCAGITVRTGRLDEAQIAALVGEFDLCVDATHPYAVEVSRNIAAACEIRGVPLRRVLRPASGGTDCVRVENAARAAEYLAGTEGNILLTTGAKELPAFSGLEPGRLFARVLPTHAGLEACEGLGLPHRNILALQGPFTRKMNEAMLEQYQIKWLVTKDGGAAGGFWEKAEAARAVGAGLIVIGRPEETGVSPETLLDELREVEHR